MSLTFAYRFGNGLYLNITNKCCCACTFCLRMDRDSVGEADSLWLEREPAAQEVLDAVAQFPSESFAEFVFCGYGEPTERLDVLIEVAKGLRAQYPDKPIRLNTNGLADLIHGKETAPLLQGLLDTVSISLNAPDAEGYTAIVNPAFGEKSFQAMLDWAVAVSGYVPNVVFSVVDTTIPPEDIQRCRDLSEKLGVPLRVRPKE